MPLLPNTPEKFYFVKLQNHGKLFFDLSPHKPQDVFLVRIKDKKREREGVVTLIGCMMNEVVFE